MEVVKVEFLEKSKLILTLNIWAFLGLTVIVVVAIFFINWIRKTKMLKSVSISEATIGIGNSSVTIKYDKRIQEIAYKIWVELNTRKIGILFDEEHDVITEVYDSWYSAFDIIRKLLEEVPAERINDAKGLIEVTTKVLNDGLRPHLTKWQAKYRNWFEEEKMNCTGKSPQEIQKIYPFYQQLVLELKQTNQMMMQFSTELIKIVYDRKEG